MTIQQLKYLLAVVDDQLDVSNAAQCLYTSQPGVSRQIMELERSARDANAPKPPLRSAAMIQRGAWAPGAVLFLALLLAGAPVAAQAQTGGAEARDETGPCRDPNSRQFDFWIGEWEVRSPEGQILGHNSIRRVPGTCALLENWRGIGDSRGMSLNVWDADRARWTQRWVGAVTLWLEGEFRAGEMVLSGTVPRRTPEGQVLDRITWTPLPDGGLRQRWEISTDKGRTWFDGFVGLYSAAGPERAEPSAESVGRRSGEQPEQEPPPGSKN